MTTGGTYESESRETRDFQISGSINAKGEEAHSSTLPNNSNKVKTARDSVIVLVGNIISTVILAISSIIVARLLGPDGYGLYIL